MPSSRRSLPLLVLAVALAAAACGQAAPTPPPASDPPAATRGAPAPAETTPAGATSTPGAAATPAGAAAVDCTAPATPTIAQTEGPYYLPGAPEGSELANDGMPGTRLTLTGHVVDAGCSPIADARVETWQADASGAYDNAGYTLRGWVRTDADGRFTIHTVVPGEYPGRTEHIHVKVTPPGGATLTTQLYFPGSTANGEDGIYDPSLDLAITEDGEALVGTTVLVLGG